MSAIISGVDGVAGASAGATDVVAAGASAGAIDVGVASVGTTTVFVAADVWCCIGYLQCFQ